MNVRSNDYLAASNPSYLIPQSTANNADDDDDDDDDAVKTSSAAAATENTNDTSVVSLTPDSAAKPLLNPNRTVPHMRYSNLRQYDQ